MTLRRALGLGLAALVAGLGTAAASTREAVLARAVEVADRLAAVKPVDRFWYDAPYLTGSVLVWELAVVVNEVEPGLGDVGYDAGEEIEGFEVLPARGPRR